MSDFNVCSFRFRVLLLQTVTVAPSLMNRRDSGFHTILLLPIMVMFFHFKSILYSSKSLFIHFGVQLISQLSSHKKSLPMFSFVNQSTSFLGSILSIISSVFMCFGRGSCTMYQLVFSFILRSSIKSKSSSCDIFSLNSICMKSIPTYSANFFFCLI